MKFAKTLKDSIFVFISSKVSKTKHYADAVSLNYGISFGAEKAVLKPREFLHMCKKKRKGVVDPGGVV